MIHFARFPHLDAPPSPSASSLAVTTCRRVRSMLQRNVIRQGARLCTGPRRYRTANLSQFKALRPRNEPRAIPPIRLYVTQHDASTSHRSSHVDAIDADSIDGLDAHASNVKQFLTKAHRDGALQIKPDQTGPLLAALASSGISASTLRNVCAREFDLVLPN